MLGDSFPYRILIADDEPAQRRLASAILQAPKYQVTLAGDGREALDWLESIDFDCVVLDRKMPAMDGYEVLRMVRNDLAERLLPIIMVTGQGEGGDAIAEALSLGATDFIRKPFDPLELAARVDAAVAHKRLTDQLEDAEAILFAQARLAEARDRHTGDHIARVARNAVVFGESLGLPADDLAILRRGAVLHDIGKLAIPDAILLKPGKLTPEEWTVMESHAVIGERLVSGLRGMRPAAEIILHHHERWDGTGYPHGLRGEEIPLLARIFQLVDIHDALTFERPYKTPLPPDEVARQINAEAERGWRDPRLAQAFLALLRKSPGILMPRPEELEDLGLRIYRDIEITGALTWGREAMA